MDTASCLFCKIARKEMESQIVYEDDRTLAFRDVNPQAPVHVLVIPKEHFGSISDIDTKDENLMGHLLYVTRKIAHDEGLTKKGFRAVINSGANAGQTVFHIHVHLLGGRAFHWPPG